MANLPLTSMNGLPITGVLGRLVYGNPLGYVLCIGYGFADPPTPKVPEYSVGLVHTSLNSLLGSYSYTYSAMINIASLAVDFEHPIGEYWGRWDEDGDYTPITVRYAATLISNADGLLDSVYLDVYYPTADDWFWYSARSVFWDSTSGTLSII